MRAVIHRDFLRALIRLKSGLPFTRAHSRSVALGQLIIMAAAATDEYSMWHWVNTERLPVYQKLGFFNGRNE